MTFDLAGAPDAHALATPRARPDNWVALATPRARPDNWVADERGWHCLRCQREAVLKQPTVEGAGTPAQQRRRALVEFELSREPAATDLEVARWVKCSSAQVAGIRSELASG